MWPIVLLRTAVHAASCRAARPLVRAQNVRLRARFTQRVAGCTRRFDTARKRMSRIEPLLGLEDVLSGRALLHWSRLGIDGHAAQRGAAEPSASRSRLPPAFSDELAQSHGRAARAPCTRARGTHGVHEFARHLHVGALIAAHWSWSAGSMLLFVLSERARRGPAPTTTLQEGKTAQKGSPYQSEQLGMPRSERARSRTMLPNSRSSSR